MTTLREILDEFDDVACPLYWAVDSWTYGQEQECPSCRGGGLDRNDLLLKDPDLPSLRHVSDCPTCDGTGIIRGPGLVERLQARLTGPVESWRVALREELGEL